MYFVETKFYYKNHFLELNFKIEYMSKKRPQKRLKNAFFRDFDPETGFRGRLVLELTSREKTGFNNSVPKNNFQRLNGLEYVSNMSQMIKIIILDGLHSHSEAYESLWKGFKKLGHSPPLKNGNSHIL